jgi:Flp pilus assembly protein TadG
VTLRRPRGDDGQILVLTAFLVFVLAGLVAVVVDVSAAFLARRSLASQADGAALAAAQSVDLEAFYRGDDPDALPLAGVDDVVRDYVAANFPETDVVAVSLSGDGTAVTVTLRRRLALPLAPPGSPDGVGVTADATARLPLR